MVMSASTENPLRITRNLVPSDDPDIEIVAGWNGNVGSYYFVATWTADKPTGVRAGDLEIEGGYPLEIIPDISDLAAWLMTYIDLSSPDVVAVFSRLLADKQLDLCVQTTEANPYGNKHLPALISKVLDKDFTPVAEAVTPAPPPPSRHGFFDPHHKARE